MFILKKKNEKKLIQSIRDLTDIDKQDVQSNSIKSCDIGSLRDIEKRSGLL